MSEYQRFLADKGELKRYDYDLNSESVVIDVGGYKGEFADSIFRKFECFVCIFEPVFFNELTLKFEGIKKIFVHEFGLSNKTERRTISVNADSTSLHRVFNENCAADFMDIVEFMQSENAIDLIKINIEGEEYNLLERMIETGIITKFKNIQVQFHSFIPDAEKRRNKIREELSKTHSCEWEYSFIWESWRLK